MKKAVLFFLFTYCMITSWAQVGIGTTTPAPGAALEIKDTARGLLIPRMTMVQRNTISSPATGLMVYQTDSTKGFWYFDGAVWKNVNASSNYGGKPVLIISDSLTNAQAQAKIAAEFGPNTQEIRIKSCLYLTSIDLSMFTTASSITITDNPVLQTVNLGSLKTCEGYFNFNNCPVLNNVNMNSLEKVLHNSDLASVAFYFNKTGLSSINCPKLKSVLGVMQISNNPVLSSILLPVLSEELASLYVMFNPSLPNITFPVLKKLGVMTVNDNNALTTINLPSLTAFTLNDNGSYYESRMTRCPLLTSILLGNLQSFANYGFGTMLSSALTQANVNDLLHKFASIIPPITGKTIYLDFQNPPAPPTGQGLIDKAFLIAHGNSVTTD